MVCRGGHRPHALACILAVVAASLGMAFHAGSAEAAPGLLVGATDDLFMNNPQSAKAAADDLGLNAARVSFSWGLDQTALTPQESAELRAAASTGARVVVAAYASGDFAPQTDARRDAYCSFLRDALIQVPQVNDVVIWNEPNLSFFWRPQFDAAGNNASAAAYEQLMARCWDVLHAYRPSVNVIGFATCPLGMDDPWGSSVSTSPVSFIAGVGQAYRASGRTAPLFDTVDHHAYGITAAERPWASHLYSPKRISEGDIGRLVGYLQSAFAGTGQAVPGAPVGGKTVSIWYLESGFETTPTPAKLPAYSGREIVDTIPDFTGSLPWVTLPTAPGPDQAVQLRDALRLAYCQPYVGAIFNFLLEDEPGLGNWQSGVLWADGTPKGSYDTWRSTIAQVKAHAVDCAQFAGAGGAVVPPDDPAAPVAQTPPLQGTAPHHLPPPPGGGEGPPRPPHGSARAPAKFTISWVRGVRGRYTHRNRVWIVSVRSNARAAFRATIETPRGDHSLQKRGKLAANAPTRISFSRRPLKVGTYRVVVRASGYALRSARFRVH